MHQVFGRDPAAGRNSVNCILFTSLRARLPGAQRNNPPAMPDRHTDGLPRPALRPLAPEDVLHCLAG